MKNEIKNFCIIFIFAFTAITLFKWFFCPSDLIYLCEDDQIRNSASYNSQEGSIQFNDVKVTGLKYVADSLGQAAAFSVGITAISRLMKNSSLPLSAKIPLTLGMGVGSMISFSMTRDVLNISNPNSISAQIKEVSIRSDSPNPKDPGPIGCPLEANESFNWFYWLHEHLTLHFYLHLIIVYLLVQLLIFYTMKLLATYNFKFELVKKWPFGYYIQWLLLKSLNLWNKTSNIWIYLIIIFLIIFASSSTFSLYMILINFPTLGVVPFSKFKTVPEPKNSNTNKFISDAENWGSLVPFNKYNTNNTESFSWEDIANENYNLNYLLSTRILPWVVLEKLKSEKGCWLLTVSNIGENEVRNIKVYTNDYQDCGLINSLDSKGNFKHFDFVHNMVKIPLNLSKLNSDYGFSKLESYSLEQVELILNKNLSELEVKLATLNFHLGIARSESQRAIIKKKIYLLELDVSKAGGSLASDSRFGIPYSPATSVSINIAPQVKTSDMISFNTNFAVIEESLEAPISVSMIPVSLSIALVFSLVAAVEKEISLLEKSLVITSLAILEKKINWAHASFTLLEREYLDIIIEGRKSINIQTFNNQFNFETPLASFVTKHFENLISDKVIMPGIIKELSLVNFNEATTDQMLDFVHLIFTISETLSSIGTKDGFLRTIDFSCPRTFPFLNTMVYRTLNFEEDIKEDLTAEEKESIIQKRIENPIEYFQELQASWTTSNREKFYNSLINLIYLHLYIMLQYSLAIMNKDPRYGLEKTDLKYRVKNLAKVILGTIDKDIRQKLKAPSVKLNKFIACGYDTEYQGLDIGKVKRLTGQIACSAEVQITVTKRSKYNLSGINSLTGESYIKNAPEIKGNDWNKVLGLLNNSIDFILPILHGEKEQIADLTDRYLLNHSEAKLIENEFQNIYIFPLNDSNNKKKIKTALIDLAKLDEDNKVEVQNSKNSQKMMEIKNKKVWNFEGLIQDYITPTFSYELDLLSDQLVEGIRNYVRKYIHPFESLQKVEVEGGSCYDILNQEYNIEEETPQKLKNILSSPNIYYMIYSLKIKISKNLTIISHFNAAEFSLFDDFNEFKKELAIIKKSFITMGLPKKFGSLDWKVTVRDSILLTSAATAALSQLGLMHKFEKDDLSLEEKNNMEFLKNSNFERFKKYAIKDSVITLRHGLFVLGFIRANTFKNDIPVTLSCLAKRTLLTHWKTNKYRGYKLDLEGLGLNSKGMNVYGQPLINMNLYIAAIKGGRNESFMFGRDTKTTWYDWDLSGCYNTVMSGLGDPVYQKATPLNSTHSNLFQTAEQKEALLNSYTVMNVDFEFPENVKYPTLPANVDKNIDCYPRKGNSNCTGVEYLLAQNLGAKLNIINGCMIPFKVKLNDKKENELADPPFKSFVQTVQNNRKKYGKGHPSERMWKDIGNMVYGQTFQGIAGKKSFDTKTETMVTIPGSDLTSPIIGSWIPGNARAVVGECLNNINKIGGKVVSVTTDGFITNLPNVEDQIINYNSLHSEPIDENNSPASNSKNENSAAPSPFVFDDYRLASIKKDPSKDPYSDPVALKEKVFQHLYDDRVRLFGEKAIGSNYISEPHLRKEASEIVEREISMKQRGSKFEKTVDEAMGKPIEQHFHEDRDRKLRDSNIKMKSKLDTTCLDRFRRWRKALGHEEIAFELKTSMIGMNSWSTRGQLGITQPDPNSKQTIVAMTGFQRKGIPHDVIVGKVKQCFSSPKKQIPFLQFRLRGATDIFKKGGHVTPTYMERKFRILHDSRRDLIIPENLDPKFTKIEKGIAYIDPTVDEGIIFDSKPWDHVGSCKLHRFVLNRVKSPIYLANDFSGRILPSLMSNQQVFFRHLLRYFIKENYNNFFIIDFAAKFMKELGIVKRLSKTLFMATSNYTEALKLQGDFVPGALDKYIHKSYFQKAQFIADQLKPSKLFTKYIGNIAALITPDQSCFEESKSSTPNVYFDPENDNLLTAQEDKDQGPCDMDYSFKDLGHVLHFTVPFKLSLKENDFFSS